MMRISGSAHFLDDLPYQYLLLIPYHLPQYQTLFPTHLTLFQYQKMKTNRLTLNKKSLTNQQQMHTLIKWKSQTYLAMTGVNAHSVIALTYMCQHDLALQALGDMVGVLQQQPMQHSANKCTPCLPQMEWRSWVGLPCRPNRMRTKYSLQA
jgi:hypothetical protein